MAEAQNLQVFEKMAQKMKDGDFSSFREATTLLATWLTKKQAYYPGALPQILRLLFVAQLRVRDEVKFDRFPLLFRARRYGDNPFATAYISLVNAIISFQDAFLKTDKGLRDGYQQLVASVSADPPEHETPHRSPTPPPTVETANNLVPPQIFPEVTQTCQVPSVTALVSLAVNESVQFEASTSTESATSAPTLLQTESSTCESNENIQSVGLDPGEQLQDIPTYMVPQPALSSPLNQDIELTTVDIATLDFDLLAEIDLLRKDAQTPQEDHDGLDQPEEIPTSPIIAIPDVNDLEYNISANLTKDPYDTETAKATEVSTISSIDQIPPLASTVVVDQMDVDPMAVQTPLNESIASVQGLSHPVDEAAGMSIQGDINPGRNEAPSNGSNAMEVDDLGSAALPNPTLGQQLPNKVAESPGPTKSDSLTRMDSPSSIWEMAVIARQRGLDGNYRVFIDFNLSSRQFELVKKWSQRSGDFAELQSSICVTLGCYRLIDLKEQFDTGRLSSFEQQVSCTESKWPSQRGCLNIKIISAEGKEENLPLSPPFQVTPNNLLDLSDLLTEGRNRLQLHQSIDLRQFLFVVHAHHPTRQQLERVRGHMLKKQEWEQFLEDFAAPLACDSLASLLSSRAARV